MNRVVKAEQKKITIHQGEYHVSDDSVVISTLLGSCISACLYDPVNRVIGMNHFLLGNRGHLRETPICMTEAGRYGVHAMELVINGMFKLGAHRSHLRAKVFGGSSFFRPEEDRDAFSRVGAVNRRFILEFLENDGIPIVASDLGGDRGRTIHFSSDDYSVMVKKTPPIVPCALLNRERRFWLRSMKSNDAAAGKPDLWI